MRKSGKSLRPPRLDDDFAAPLSFSVMSALQGDAELEFGTLRRIVECEGSLLSGVIARLAHAGHLAVRDVSFGDAPGTWVRATPRGTDAFSDHLAALREIVERREAEV
ncbi:MAG: transcriptional regulator [Microbacterium sp.]|jgi:hypothetical protein|uniref:transcriptional regulator n=1 Tax=Microbacterium sp. TaxID=51671 RepID=UPI002631C0CE|nr:transcriptional regulator [Microbacterium sp.]MDF2561507.1 transcriptional regulator [Microbacterium sp.]